VLASITIEGKFIKSSSEKDVIDISGLPAGCYIVSINQEGNKIRTILIENDYFWA
jgi:hypothetical protein